LCNPSPPSPISATAADLGVNGEVFKLDEEEEDAVAAAATASEETNNRSLRSTVNASTEGDMSPNTHNPAVTSHTMGDRLLLAGASSMRGVPSITGKRARAPRTHPRIVSFHVVDVEQSLRIKVMSSWVTSGAMYPEIPNSSPRIETLLTCFPPEGSRPYVWRLRDLDTSRRSLAAVAPEPAFNLVEEEEEE